MSADKLSSLLLLRKFCFYVNFILNCLVWLFLLSELHSRLIETDMKIFADLTFLDIFKIFFF